MEMILGRLFQPRRLPKSIALISSQQPVRSQVIEEPAGEVDILP
jgi:hypothetical protein